MYGKIENGDFRVYESTYKTKKIWKLTVMSKDCIEKSENYKTEYYYATAEIAESDIVERIHELAIKYQLGNIAITGRDSYKWGYKDGCRTCEIEYEPQKVVYAEVAEVELITEKVVDEVPVW